MTSVFQEGALEFRFQDGQPACKYDEMKDYREKVAKLNATKAVDFLYVFEQRDLYFIEVKDLREHRIENKGRDLAVEIALKVRDTTAGVVGAWRTSGDHDAWKPFFEALASQERRLCVILWLEEDLPFGPPGREKNRSQVLGEQIKTLLRWLTTHVLVTNNDADVPGLSVKGLKRSTP